MYLDPTDDGLPMTDRFVSRNPKFWPEKSIMSQLGWGVGNEVNPSYTMMLSSNYVIQSTESEGMNLERNSLFSQHSGTLVEVGPL